MIVRKHIFSIQSIWISKPAILWAVETPWLRSAIQCRANNSCGSIFWCLSILNKIGVDIYSSKVSRSKLQICCSCPRGNCVRCSYLFFTKTNLFLLFGFSLCSNSNLPMDLIRGVSFSNP